MSNFKLKVIKVSIPGESFWLNYIGEDSKYIYGTRYKPLQKNIVTIFNDGLLN